MEHIKALVAIQFYLLINVLMVALSAYLTVPEFSGYVLATGLFFQSVFSLAVFANKFLTGKDHGVA